MVWKLYKILRGDTCWQIAEDSGTTVEKLRGINKGLNCDAFEAGYAHVCARDVVLMDLQNSKFLGPCPCIMMPNAAK